MSVESRLKATQIIGQRKGFYRQITTEFSCGRKVAIDIDILVTSGYGYRKIMQSIRITSRPLTRITKWNQSPVTSGTSTKVIPIKKISVGHTTTMNQELKRDSK